MRIFFLLWFALLPGFLFASERAAYELSWKSDAVLLTAGVGLFGWGQWRLSHMEPYEEGDFDKGDLLPWDRPFAGTWNPKADLASDILCVAGVLPLVISTRAWHSGDIRGQDVGVQVVMLTEVLALQGGINLLVRSAEIWPRPFLFGSRGGSERDAAGASGSFYSGHASAAFAVAVFTGTWFDETFPHNQWSPWIWGGSLLAASSVAGLRVASGKHYPSDVLAGALIGSAIGWMVPWLHRVDSPIKIAPQPGGAIGHYSF